MPLDSFSFGSTHSWSDHPQVKAAADIINALPQYAGGYARIPSSFSLSFIKNKLSDMASFEASELKKIEDARCKGYNAETIGAMKKVVGDIESYESSLKTIADYMESYNGCGCRR